MVQMKQLDQSEANETSQTDLAYVDTSHQEEETQDGKDTEAGMVQAGDEEEELEHGEEEDMRLQTPDQREWIVSSDPEQSSIPSEAMAMEALEFGATAWQDQRTQKWSMAFAKDVTVPGVQWWIPGSCLKLKVDNTAHSSSTIPEGMVVAEAFAVNCDDMERMVLLKKRLPETQLEEKEEDHPHIEPRAEAPPPQPGEPEDPGADFSKAKIGQMGPESRRRVLEMLQECKAFFPKNTKIVNILTGREVELPLYDKNAKPFACKAQRFNPPMSDILMDQIKDMLDAGLLSFANSEWFARMVPVKKSDGTYQAQDLQLPFEDKFSHFVWGPDLGLVEDSVVAAPLYTLIDRKPTQGAGSVSEAWAWEYRAKYQDGSTSSWLTEDEVKDSFSPLQLDVFHTLWEDYHGPDIAPRPPGAPTRGEREVATREAALKEFPLNTEVGRELQDNNANVIITRGKVCDFYDPYWRVEFSDGDWEELTRRELRRGIAYASQVPPSAS
eukprot:g4607.t1